MRQPIKKHYVASAILALAAIGSIALANGVANAKDFDSASTQVETIEIDIEQEVATPETGTKVVAADADNSSTQFLYLVGLASIGLIGIAGIVRDVRRDSGA